MSTAEVDTTLAKSPRRRLAVPLLALSVACAVVSALGYFCFLPLVGIALAAWADRRSHLEAANARRRVVFFLTGLAVVVLHGFVLLGWLAVARDSSLIAVPASNLRGLGQGLRQYHSTHGEHASSLGDVVLAGFATPKEVISPFDDLRESRAGEVLRSSFTYFPGVGPWRADAELILAHDRAPFASQGRGLTRRAGHLVLFADQHVEWLPVDAFNRALAADRARRAALGWPVDPQVPIVRLPADGSPDRHSGPDSRPHPATAPSTSDAATTAPAGQVAAFNSSAGRKRAG